MKQGIDFIKCNPTQNMTILVKTNYPADEYKHIAAKMMSYDSVYAEQVGFIEKPLNERAAAHLQMAGGEFCGNACMALAAFIASEKDLKQHDWTEVLLEVSGADQLIMCQVKKNVDEYNCRVAMPIPEKIEQKTVKYDGSDLNLIIVRYHGFLHIVIEVKECSETVREKAQSLAKLLGVTLDANLIGVLLYQPKSDELAPLIYVPHLDSMVWERGCGSGTASIGAYLAWKNKRGIRANIKQPGGTIRVFADVEKEELTNLIIEGSVSIVAEGKAFINI
ncbi:MULTISPECIES: diaminopimelate epimerase [Bacillus]|uniref:diaminopimelate epimerase n=1 Tax=Bacillus TaxID=1386 RepID=UPI000400580F|nr:MULTISPECIES: diaminopimelate epimerase [Bacillus]QHZ46896.1 diaminopimelate epimerase [Bacillus sp. NSP9.1]WFA07028.1 diaminopimelate epimerase [Bacillus sp. HSf4]